MRLALATHGAGGAYIVVQAAHCEHKVEDSEISNRLLFSLLQPWGNKSGVMAAVERRFALQDKQKLSAILTRLNFGSYTPALFDYPRQQPGAYPVILKRETGTYGQGIFIVKSAKELSKRFKAVNERSGADAQAQVGVNFIVQEAVWNATEHIVHYLRTPPTFPGEGWVRFWCGVYAKDAWAAKGLWIKGDRDRRPFLRRTPCDTRVLHVLRATLHAERVSGMGCINHKYSGDQPKIFDWNLRQCGSMDARVLEQLLREEVPKDTVTQRKPLPARG